MLVKGSFEVNMHGEPPYATADGVALGRASLDKQFSGPLEATSTAQMLSVGTPVKGSAAYVAVERIAGTLEGKRGSVVVVHTGLMNRGVRQLLSVTIVPDSGTGELAGISGKIEIQIEGGKHFYELDYALGS